MAAAAKEPTVGCTIPPDTTISLSSVLMSLYIPPAQNNVLAPIHNLTTP